MRIATVTNFPHGNDLISGSLAKMRNDDCLRRETEVDVVFPLPCSLIAGNEQVGFDW